MKIQFERWSEELEMFVTITISFDKEVTDENVFASVEDSLEDGEDAVNIRVIYPTSGERWHSYSPVWDLFKK